MGENVPVIILSNLNEVGKISEALAQSVHDNLVKSDWKLEDIVKRVKIKLGV